MGEIKRTTWINFSMVMLRFAWIRPGFHFLLIPVHVGVRCLLQAAKIKNAESIGQELRKNESENEFESSHEKLDQGPSTQFISYLFAMRFTKYAQSTPESKGPGTDVSL